MNLMLSALYEALRDINGVEEWLDLTYYDQTIDDYERFRVLRPSTDGVLVISHHEDEYCISKYILPMPYQLRSLDSCNHADLYGAVCMVYSNLGLNCDRITI